MKSSYSRFYAALVKLPYRGERNDLKEQLVYDYTDGRTTHLGEMTQEEYNRCCSVMESRVMLIDATKHLYRQIKKSRSIALRLMTDYGVDTTSWEAVDRFCLQSKIAGKRFAWLTLAELVRLERKMRAILNKKLHTQPINQ